MFFLKKNRRCTQHIIINTILWIIIYYYFIFFGLMRIQRSIAETAPCKFCSMLKYTLMLFLHFVESCTTQSTQYYNYMYIFNIILYGDNYYYIQRSSKRLLSRRTNVHYICIFDYTLIATNETIECVRFLH